MCSFRKRTIRCTRSEHVNSALMRWDTWSVQAALYSGTERVFTSLGCQRVWNACKVAGLVWQKETSDFMNEKTQQYLPSSINLQHAGMMCLTAPEPESSPEYPLSSHDT